MDIKERAKQYAEGKALEAITSAIEQAFVEGYNQGYTEGRADEKNSRTVTTSIDDYDIVTFVDLGLPSGTKWPSNYLLKGGYTCYFTYDEAEKLNIPTLEQLKELILYCRSDTIYKSSNVKDGIRIVGPNGNHIKVGCTQYRKDSKGSFLGSAYLPMFWLNDQSQDNNIIDKKCAWFSDKLGMNTLFKGYRVPVMIISK